MWLNIGLCGKNNIIRTTPVLVSYLKQAHSPIFFFTVLRIEIHISLLKMGMEKSVCLLVCEYSNSATCLAS